MAINSVTVAGHLGGDVEVKDTSNDHKIAILNVAVDNSYKDSDGEYIKRTSWLRCITYRPKFVASLEKYATKGAFVGIEGKIVSRTFEDKDGKKAIITEIEMNHLEYLSKRNTESEEEEDEE